MGTEVATLRPLREVVEEYEAKDRALTANINAFKEAETALRRDTCIGGTWVASPFDRDPYVNETHVRRALLQSAWKHVYNGLNLRTIAPLADRERFERELQDPPPFTLENLAATFGDYVARPRHHILKGLAEIFVGLDPAFKSHSKVKVGVAKLPKRIIMGGYSRFSTYGKERTSDVLNALAAYQGKPLLDYEEWRALEGNPDALLTSWSLKTRNIKTHAEEVKTFPARGIRLKIFGNGNGHLFFEPDTLADVNRALAEFYGDVLPDTPDEAPAKRRSSTDVSTDLQFYPTPRKVIDRILRDWRAPEAGKNRALEPSCGDGRMMAALRGKGYRVTGVEVDPLRAAVAQRDNPLATVITGNFLELTPEPAFDLVLMNPPFFGTHYAKHVTKATKWLKPGGALIAILPITARTDHGLLEKAWAEENGMWLSGYTRDGAWNDLPVGSFSESGTNINTTVFRAFKRD